MKKNIYLVLVLFFTSFFNLSAQTYTWSTSLGGTKTTPLPTEDAIKDVAVDAAGNVYVVGYYTASMTMPIAPLTATNGGLQDIFLAKYNSTGVMQWHQKAGVAQGDKGLSIAVNTAGEVYMAGSFQGSVFFKFAAGANLVSNGANPDMCLVKYSAAGVVQWSRGVGSPGPDEAISVELDASENPVVAAYISAGTTNIYTESNTPTILGTMTSNGSLDVALIQFDPAGGYTGSNVYGSVAGAERPTVMKIDPSNNIYMAGVFFNTVDFDPIGTTNVTESAPQGSGDAFIAKYSASGSALAWVGSISGVNVEDVKDLGIDGSGNLYVVGSFTGFVNFDLLGGTQNKTSVGLKDIFIAKYNASTGAFISVNQIGGTGDDEANGIHVLSSGDFYMTGSFSGSSIDFDPSAGTNSLTSAGTTDAFLAKYNSSIVNSWAHRVGSATGDVGYTVTSTSGGDILWAGSYTGTIDADPGVGVASHTSVGAEDMFLFSYLESCIGAAITTQPAATQTLCSGSPASFTVAASGTGITYQWKKGATSLTNGGTISGATSATLNISSLVLGDAATYTVDVIGCAGTVVSNSSVLTVNAGAAITTQPLASQNLCAGSPASFTVAATGTSLTYQWKKGATSLVNGGTISGATSATLNISSLVLGDAATYTCDVTASGCGSPVTTTASVLTVNTAAAITTQPAATQTLCVGAAAGFSVVATGTGLTYQWKKGGVALSNGGTISGVATANLAISSLVPGDAGTYSVDVIGCAGTVVSTNSNLTVTSGAAIIVQPAATQTLCSGSPASFSVIASGGGLTYQWKKGATSLVNGGTISGATSSTLNISSLVPGDAATYTVDVIGCSGTVVSSNSVLNVNTAAAITTQPVATQTLCVGSPASFAVTATGTGLTYQWNKGGSPLSNGGTISGATTANLAISSLVAGDAATYTVDVVGCAGTIVSTNSNLTVTSGAAIIVQPAATQTLCSGSPASFSVIASGGGLTYQWKKGATSLTNGGTISGATSATLNISSLIVGDAGNYTVDVIGCAGTVVSSASALTVNSGAAITTQPVATQTFCSGSAASFAVVATGTGLTYQWKLGATALVDGGTISGATTATLDISAVVAGDAGNYTCDITASGCGSPITTTVSVLNVNAPAVITTQPLATQTLCTGNAASFAVVATGTGLTYQWNLGGTPLSDGGTISGATSATLDISSLIAGDAGNYTVDVIGCAGTVVSSISALTVNSGAAITTQPVATQTFCSGSAASFSVVATGTGLTYQWKLGATALVDGGTISGATTATLDISSVVAGDAGNYTCDITASGCGSPITTTVSVLNVNTAASITIQPVATQTLCTGNAASFSVLATGTGLTYQWNLGGTPLSDGGTISGATSATLDISSLIVGDAGNYTVDVIGCAGTVVSSASALTVNSGAAITTQPVATQTFCSGSAASFAVVATGTGLTYQWKLGATALVDGGTISGATTATLDISAVVAGDAGNYTCDITASGCGSPITTTVSVLNVNAPAVITTQPLATQTLCTGNAASFAVVATGTGLTYQWNLGGTPLSDGGTISGATSATLDISSLIAGDAGNYTVDVIGCAGTVVSSISALTVNSGAAITTQPVATQTFCSGSAASFSVVATGTGLTYQWKLGATALVDGGTISGATTATLDISSVVAGDAGNYTCDITASGCGSPITTTVSVLNVNTAASITTQPVATQTLCTGNAASFSVLATGTGLTYQWNLGGTPLSDGGTISGATSATLDISSLIVGDAGNYTVDVIGCAGTVVSLASALTVNSGAAITTQPVATQTFCSGSAASFAVVATGTGLTYQWKLGATALVDGGTITGATTATLDISSVVAGDAGNYTCDITASGCGAPITTTVSVLNVNSAASITTQPVATQTLCTGNAASFAVVATGTGLTYQWNLGGTPLSDGGTISGATSATLDISSLIAGDAGTYTVDVIGCLGTVVSTNSDLIVNIGAAITTQPLATQTFCSGAAASFSVVATGTGLTYQWKLGATALVDGGTITGATTATLDISAVVAGDAGNYTCDITASGCGAPITTTVSVLNVNSAASITTQPVATQTLCTGNAASFAVVATGTGLTYQWNLGGTPLSDGGTISGATSATLDISSLIAGDAGTYTVDVIGCLGTVVSTNSDLIVNIGAAITTQPLATQTFCSGAAASFSVVATGTGLTYQWNLGGAPLSDGGTISGATSATLDISSVVAGDAGNYTCDITASGCGAPITTTVSVLNVNTAAAITTQPVATQTFCSGSAVSFNVIATGTGLTYQWSLGGTPLADGGTISGVTTATLDISSIVAGDAGNYTCDVTSSACGAAVTTSVSVLNVSSGSAVITTQPFDINACAGMPVTFDLIATGASLTYQWKKDGVVMVDGGNVSGATTSSLVLTAAVLSDAATYTCDVSSTCGAPVVSSNAVLTVSPSTVVFTTQPFSAVVCLNQQASFKVVAVGGLTFQWQYKPAAGVYADIADGGQISGATTATLVVDNAQFVNRGNYRCIVSSGACSGGTASAAAGLTFETPMIVSEPVSQSLCTGQGVTFGVVALGNNLSYQWFKSGSLMGNIPYKVQGATKATLQIFDINAADEALYYCVVQGLCPPPAFSDNVSLFVNICNPTAIEDSETVSAFSVYPNPSEGVFSLKLNNNISSDASYDVFSTLGEIVYSDKIGNSGSASINLENQAAGLYLLRVTMGEEQVWERLVVEK